MSFLFGSQPKIQQVSAPTPTISPQQQAILSQLQGLFQSGATPPGVQAYGGNFAAPLNPLQTASLQGFENIANNVTGTPGTVDPSMLRSVYANALNAPNPGQVTAPYTPAPITSAPVSATNITAPQIDASQLIQQSIVGPALEAWNKSILPGILGNYGRSAGGAYSSDAEQARAQAGAQLETGIASAAGTAGYEAAAANQRATLAALTSNQAADLQAGEFTSAAGTGAQEATVQERLAAQGQDITAQQAQVSANEFQQNVILSALGLAPTVGAAPYTGAGAEAGVLGSTLGAGAVPYNVAQQQLTGSYQDFLNQLQQRQQLLALMGGSFSPQTLTAPTFASLPGQSGLIPSLLGGVASNPGIGLSLSRLLLNA